MKASRYNLKNEKHNFLHNNLNKFNFFKLIGWAFVLGTIAIGSYYGRDIYLKQKYPCRYRTYERLMFDYPDLEVIWDKKAKYLIERETAYNDYSIKLDLSVKNGSVSEWKEAFCKKQAFFNQTLAGEKVINDEFQQKCKQLTGEK